MQNTNDLTPWISAYDAAVRAFAPACGCSAGQCKLGVWAWCPERNGGTMAKFNCPDEGNPACALRGCASKGCVRRRVAEALGEVFEDDPAPVVERSLLPLLTERLPKIGEA